MRVIEHLVKTSCDLVIAKPGFKVARSCFFCSDKDHSILRPAKRIARAKQGKA